MNIFFKNIIFCFLTFQQILLPFWNKNINNIFGQNITLGSNFPLNQSFNFSQNVFCKKLFVQNKLEDAYDNSGLKISHDGKYYSFIEVNQDSKLAISILETNTSKKKNSITLNCSKIYKYGWCHDSSYLWYLADKLGDERYQLYSINRTTLKIKNLIQLADIKIDFVKSSSLFPLEILIKINNPMSAYYDIYKINIKTGQLDLVFKNTEKLINFIADSKFKICFAEKITENCARDIYKKTEEGWSLFDKISFEDYQTSELLHISFDGTKLYMKDSRDQNTAALVEINLLDNSKKILAIDESGKADLSKISINPQSLEVEATCFSLEKDRWKYFESFDNQTKLFFENLTNKKNCVIDIIDRSLIDEFWIISITTSKELEYYLYQKKTLTINFVGGTSWKRKTFHRVIKSRDGLDLVSYLTLPPSIFNEKEKLSPMILMVHGGPWDRDNLSVSQRHQFFSERGFAVLSVNFRGSTGFGKFFLNASWGEWGRKMIDDLIDATRWAIDQGIADHFKIGICGDSYGGFATLAALTFEPEIFACGVSFSGASSLTTLIENLPSDWTSEKSWFLKMIGGDEQAFEGEGCLQSQSPLFFSNQIKRPLLIGHGKNDPRVKMIEAESIFNKIKSNNISATYALFPDEGHFLSKPANADIFQELTLQFFERHLKGNNYEISDELFYNSSVLIQNHLAKT